MFTGGVPKYLQILKEKPSIKIGIEEEAFSSTGYFFSEYEKIFISHFGKNNTYKKIINIFAQHPYGLFRKQISESINIGIGGQLSNHLKNLESAGFISSNTPLDKNVNSKHIKYFLSDAYYTWLGRSFEQLCFKHAEKIAQILGFSGIDYSYGPYFKPPKNNLPGF